MELLTALNNPFVSLKLVQSFCLFIVPVQSVAVNRWVDMQNKFSVSVKLEHHSF